MPKTKVLKLYKKVGETPLECLNRFRKANSKYMHEKMTYAGRLDPMAEGALLVLVGEECKNKDRYLAFDKEYEMDVLFGFETDSYDLLGLAKSETGQSSIFSVLGSPRQNFGQTLKNPTLTDFLKTFVRKFTQKYPPYSSRYFAKARTGKLVDDEILSKEVEIYGIKLLKNKNISKKSLHNYIIKSVNKVKGDFRQKKILAKWKIVLQKSKLKKFPVISLKVRCSSGTYMRSLAHNIGNEVGVPASVLRLKRTRIYQ